MLFANSGLAVVHEANAWDYRFEPEEMLINVGDSVVWTAWGADHSVTANQGAFDSNATYDPAIPILREFSFTFHEPGTYAFYCVNHPQMVGTITVTGDGPTNQIPAAPVNLFPAAGATNVPAAAELRSSAFLDADVGDTHPVSQWVVRRADDDRVIYDSGAVNSDGRFTGSRTNRFLPAEALSPGTAYRWQVRHKDSYGGWSPYSAATTFMTIAPSLASVRRGTNVVMTWPTNAAGYSLEYTTNLPAAGWLPAVPKPAVLGGDNVVTNGLGDTLRIYRLRKP